MRHHYFDGYRGSSEKKCKKVHYHKGGECMREHEKCHKDKYERRPCCDRCGHFHCECHRHKDNGALVEKIVCIKNTSKAAELLLPVSIESIPILDELLGFLGGLENVTIEPDYSGIQEENTIVNDYVISVGYIPAVIRVAGTIVDLLALSIPIRIYFQSHTECPGVRPGDRIMSTAPVVEAEMKRPLLTENGDINLFLFKAILSSRITVVRQGIMKNGKVCDLDSNACNQVSKPIPLRTPDTLQANRTPLSSTRSIQSRQNDTR